jgi:diaminohydroxyphosphoribosylaminopyrimidine deaminase/5-amino-6-(5-phosphoribosylamino)uracil reductase
MDISELYMARCLELAARGKGCVAPNPLVGAVLVCDNRIIGEGFHRCYGGAHAEVNAIVSVNDESALRKATLYVNLEPCSHDGKTPPCTKLIIEKKIPRVVVACLDPYPEVAGRGFKRLREAGVEVVAGVMEREAIDLNRFFMTAQTKHRPYIILKWAQSADGYIDRIRKDASEKPTALSTPLTRLGVHKLRSEVQAILVGTNTAVMDNPLLTVRYWSGNSPVRVLIDRHLRVSADTHLLDGAQQTFVFTEIAPATQVSAIRTSAVSNRITYIRIEASSHFLADVMEALYERKIGSLLVEGGARLHQSLISDGLWDEMVVETAPVCLENGVKAPRYDSCKGRRLCGRQFVPADLSMREKASFIERYVHDPD